MNWLEKQGVALLLAIAGLAAFAMMMFGAGDAFATFFGVPIPGAVEFAELLMVLVVFLALPEVQATRKHIAIDIVSSRFPPSFARPLTVLAALLSLAFYGAMAWQAWRLFGDSWKISEQTAGLVKLPVYPTKALFAAALTVVTAIALRQLVQSLLHKEAASRVDSTVEL